MDSPIKSIEKESVCHQPYNLLKETKKGILPGHGGMHGGSIQEMGEQIPVRSLLVEGQTSLHKLVQGQPGLHCETISIFKKKKLKSPFPLSKYSSVLGHSPIQA